MNDISKKSNQYQIDFLIKPIKTISKASFLSYLMLILGIIVIYFIFLIKAKTSEINMESKFIMNQKYNLNQMTQQTNARTQQLNNFNRQLTMIEKEKDKLLQLILILKSEIYSMDIAIKNKELSIDKQKTKLITYDIIHKEYQPLFDEINKSEIEMKQLRIAIDLIKTGELSGNKINSKIISSQEQLALIQEWLNKGKFEVILLYRYEDDPLREPTKFHEKLANIPHTLTLIQAENNLIIGGYTKETWDGQGYKNDREAFIFNLGQKKKYDVNDSSKAIYAASNSFADFGAGDIMIFKGKLYSSFPKSYSSHYPYLQLTEGEEVLPLVHYEVFQLLFKN